MIRYTCGHTVDDPRNILHSVVCVHCWNACRDGKDSQLPYDPSGSYQTASLTLTPENPSLACVVAPIDGSHASINPRWRAILSTSNVLMVHSQWSEYRDSHDR